MDTVSTRGTEVEVGTVAIGGSGGTEGTVHRHTIRIAIDPNSEEQIWLEDEKGKRLPAKTRAEMYPHDRPVLLQVAVPIMLLQHTASPASCCMKFGNTWYPIC